MNDSVFPRIYDNRNGIFNRQIFRQHGKGLLQQRQLVIDSNLRRMIEDGYSLEDIPEGSVRIEELLNYFQYDYAGPKKGDMFSPDIIHTDEIISIYGFFGKK